MKKLLFALAIIAAAASGAFAQEKSKVVKDEKTVKKTSSIPQKVHNTFSKHKKYNGKKIKHTKVVKKTTPAQ